MGSSFLALGAQSLSHWLTSEVHGVCSLLTTASLTFEKQNIFYNLDNIPQCVLLPCVAPLQTPKPTWGHYFLAPHKKASFLFHVHTLTWDRTHIPHNSKDFNAFTGIAIITNLGHFYHLQKNPATFSSPPPPSLARSCHHYMNLPSVSMDPCLAFHMNEKIYLL